MPFPPASRQRGRLRVVSPRTRKGWRAREAQAATRPDARRCRVPVERHSGPRAGRRPAPTSAGSRRPGRPPAAVHLRPVPAVRQRQRGPPVGRGAAAGDPGAAPGADRDRPGHRGAPYRHLRRLGRLRSQGHRHPPGQDAAAPGQGAHPGEQEQGHQLRGVQDTGRPVPGAAVRLRRADGLPRLRPHGRHADGSNQLNGYADTCDPACYAPVPGNTGDSVADPWHWQPLRVPLGIGPEQRATTPHWSKVKSFALTSPVQFVPPGPDRLADGSFDPRHIDNLLALTSGPSGLGLTDPQKVTAEFWADGPRSEFPPGHWALIAQVVSRKRGHSLDYDVQMFFALGNALLDASIAAWAAKYKWDFVRPITAIRERYRDQMVTSWRGPYQGYGQVLGQNWIPYQSPKVVTPPFPEYVSGHSTFSSAAATILNLFTGSDTFNAYVTVKAGTSLFEPRNDSLGQPGTPASDVVLSWPTLTAAAKDAGLSRRLGGIHFQDGDEDGYALGRSVGANTVVKTLQYINGPPIG